MDKMTKFANDFRQLLVQKIKDKKIDLPIAKVLKPQLVFQEVDGEMRYFIDPEIIDNIPDEIMEEIETLWTSD